MDYSFCYFISSRESVLISVSVPVYVISLVPVPVLVLVSVSFASFGFGSSFEFQFRVFLYMTANKFDILFSIIAAGLAMLIAQGTMQMKNQSMSSCTAVAQCSTTTVIPHSDQCESLKDLDSAQWRSYLTTGPTATLYTGPHFKLSPDGRVTCVTMPHLSMQVRAMSAYLHPVHQMVFLPYPHTRKRKHGRWSTLEIRSFDQRIIKHQIGSFRPPPFQIPSIIIPQRLRFHMFVRETFFEEFSRAEFGKKKFVPGQSTATLWHENMWRIVDHNNRKLWVGSTNKSTRHVAI